jgi:hypothetical protein
MIAQLFAAVVAELSALQLPHWLIIAGSVLVIVGTVGVLVSGRRRGDAPPEPSQREETELQEQKPDPRGHDKDQTSADNQRVRGSDKL